MSDKMYRESDYNNYPLPQCAQQPENPQRTDNFLPSYTFNSISAVPISNNVYSQPQGQPVYNIMYGNQGMYRNHSTTPINTFGQQMDTTASWISDPCLTAVSISDKDKQIKLPSTQLSPASCCSSVDPLTCSPLPDFYKAINKDLYSKAMLDSQWFHGSNYNNQKYNEFPSCSQILANNSDDCTGKFCNIQTEKIYGYSPGNGTNVPYSHQTKVYNSCQISQLDCSIFESYEEKQMVLNENSSCVVLSDHDTFYSQNHVVCNENLPFEAIPSLEVKSADGGGESDIIVEESDDEAEDSDENDKEETHCIVCNTLNTPMGAQFFILTPDSPLSMSSQKPVFKKLSDVIGPFSNRTTYYLCSHCLALVNTIDHLESNLEHTKLQLVSKFKENAHKEQQMSKKCNVPHKRKPKFKHLCGIHSFKCRICNRKFSLKTLHRLHMSKHKARSKYLCERCGKSFLRHSSLVWHLKRHRAASKKCFAKFIRAFTCDNCQKPFRTRSNLKEHRVKCAPGVGGALNAQFACDKCPKRFASGAQRKNHARLKHEKLFAATCPLCQKGFAKQSDLKTHLLSHSEEKQHKCDVCDKSYKTLSNLNHHLKFHQKKLPFSCAVCGKGFMRKEYLEAHVNIHNGLKPFPCSVCAKKFVSRKNLDAHAKTHTGEVKKKMCTVCGKDIIHGLVEHMRTHSNDKAFECGKCSTKFNTKGALAKHTKRKHEQTKKLAVG